MLVWHRCQKIITMQKFTFPLKLRLISQSVQIAAKLFIHLFNFFFKYCAAITAHDHKLFLFVACYLVSLLPLSLASLYQYSFTFEHLYFFQLKYLQYNYNCIQPLVLFDRRVKKWHKLPKYLA